MNDEAVLKVEALERGAVTDGDVPSRQRCPRGTGGKARDGGRLVILELLLLLFDCETSSSLADVRRPSIRVSHVTSGPGETRRQAEDLVVLGAQQVLLLPAVHAGADDGDLVFGVEENVLAALLRRVGELKGQATCTGDADVGQVAEPVALRLQMTVMYARCGPASPINRTDCIERRRISSCQQHQYPAASASGCLQE